MRGKLAAKRKFYANEEDGRMAMDMMLPAGVDGITMVVVDGKIVGNTGQKVSVR